MGIPSSQIAAAWAKSELVGSDWIPLREVCFAATSRRWAGKSEEEIWEYIEVNLAHIAEHLRDDASACLVDGSAARFEIDDEQPPYIRGVGRETSALLDKLRRIDPITVEVLCADVLTAFGAKAYITEKTADGGVDFIAANLNIVPAAFAVPAGCRATIIGQTKRYKEGNIITEKQVREFVGGGLLRRHLLQTDGRITPLTPVVFAFWTTSDFEPNAKIYARDVGIWFMDGHTLATYLHELGFADRVLAMPDAVHAATGR